MMIDLPKSGMSIGAQRALIKSHKELEAENAELKAKLDVYEKWFDQNAEKLKGFNMNVQALNQQDNDPTPSKVQGHGTG